jgi:signal transduction histidine kinase
VVLWFLALYALLLVVGIPAMRQLLMVRHHDTVDQALAQEVEELRLLAGSTDPDTGLPAGLDPEALLGSFLERNVPDDDEVLLGIVDGAVVGASPAPTPDGEVVDSLLSTWSATDTPRWGTTGSGAEELRWLAVPIDAGGTAAVFVVANVVGPDRAEIDAVVRTMAAVSVAVLAVATVLGWFTARRLLAPVHDLIDAAASISDTDLTTRLPVRGDDEVAQLTATFNAMLDRLEAVFRTQRQFLDDAGHELRTPLTIVRGELELLPDDPAGRAESLDLCLDELDRMARIVSDLVTLAKSEQPDFLERRPVDVAELTDGIEQRARALAPDRRWRIERVAPVVVDADPDRLTQAMVNLVTNAAQHTRPGDEIRIGSSVGPDGVLLWVSDTGPGIPADQQDRLFARFQRGEGAETRRDGIGLGLAIVEAIAHAHGGRVEVASEPGVGTRFTVVVPADTALVLDTELADLAAAQEVTP